MKSCGPEGGEKRVEEENGEGQRGDCRPDGEKRRSERGRSEREEPPLASPGEPVVLTGSHQGVGPSDQLSANPLNTP